MRRARLASLLVAALGCRSAPLPDPTPAPAPGAPNAAPAPAASAPASVAPAAPSPLADSTEIAPGQRLRFATVDEVPTGTFASPDRPELRYRVSREGDGVVLESLRDPRERYALGFTAGADALRLPGHYHVTFAREGGATRMDVLFCYQLVRTRREAAAR